jgi:hypothetical protein
MVRVKTNLLNYSRPEEFYVESTILKTLVWLHDNDTGFSLPHSEGQGLLNNIIKGFFSNVYTSTSFKLNKKYYHGDCISFFNLNRLLKT